MNIKNYADDWANDLHIDNFSKGDIVNVDVINQSIELILSTLRGERLFNPAFGSDFQLRIFDTIDPKFLEKLIDDTVEAIKKWETRITIIESQVKLTIKPDLNTVNIFIPYIINGRNIKASFEKKITN